MNVLSFQITKFDLFKILKKTNTQKNDVTSSSLTGALITQPANTHWKQFIRNNALASYIVG